MNLKSLFCGLFYKKIYMNEKRENARQWRIFYVCTRVISISIECEWEYECMGGNNEKINKQKEREEVELRRQPGLDLTFIELNLKEKI